MTTKARLIEKINSIVNENHLEGLLNYLEETNKASVQLTLNDEKDIETSNKQLQNGMFLSQGELRTKVQKWQKK